MKHLTRSCLALVVLALAGLPGCPGNQVASTFVVTKDVKAVQGGTVEVTTADSADLAGTKLDIPAGALGADTKITVAYQKDAIAPSAESAGPVAEFGPAKTAFSTPATLTLPYKLTGTQKPANLYVQVLEDDGTKSTLVGTVDAAKSIISVKVRHFTRYQAAAKAGCAADSDCKTDEACVAGVCKKKGVCTPGRDQTCNADPAISSLWGHCEDNGTCTCAAGRVLDSSGKCQKTACTADSECAPGLACLDGDCVKKTGCTPGMNQTCNGSDLVSSIWGTCNADGTCTCNQGFAVDATTGKCQPVGCSSNVGCAAGQACVNGKCEYSCAAGQTLCAGYCVDLQSSSANCGACGLACAAGTVCSAGVCVGSATCAADTDCPAGQACVNGKCTGSALTCQQAGGTCGALTAAGVDCPAGFVANGSAGSCAPGGGCCMPSTTTCGVDSECPAGEACVSGQCQVSCEAAGGKCGALTAAGVLCDPGYESNGSAGVCFAGGGCCTPKTTGCLTDADCGSAMLCFAGVCELSCEAAGGQCASLTSAGLTCPAGMVANGSAGFCGVGAGCCVPSFITCSADADCVAGKVCVNGLCQGGCAAGQTLCSGVCVDLAYNSAHCGACGAVCAAGETCNSGLCQAGSACSADADCAAGEACVAGFCVALGQTCEAAGGKCGSLTAAGVLCEAGYVANGAAGTCAIGGSCCTPATATCASDSDCLLGQVCLSGECALTCEAVGGHCGAVTATGVTCEAGFVSDGSAGFCAAGGGCCMPVTPGCAADSDCAAGQYCIAGICELSCEAAGGKCGSLTASGLTCEADYVSNGSAGVCATGGGCCMPASSACATNADCAAGQVCIAGVCR
ncbi:MAG: hypothetical protein QM765_17110 [Myxococcales bacterium]